MNPRVAAGAAPRCAGEHIKQVYFWFSCFFISRFSAEQSALAATVSQPPNRRHASCYKTATETAEAGPDAPATPRKQPKQEQRHKADDHPYKGQRQPFSLSPEPVKSNPLSRETAKSRTYHTSLLQEPRKSYRYSTRGTRGGAVKTDTPKTEEKRAKNRRQKTSSEQKAMLAYQSSLSTPSPSPPSVLECFRSFTPAA